MIVNRTAVVTGGARGIGAAIALRLAKDGHNVAVIDLREEDTQAVVQEIEAAGGKALGIGADVTNEESANQAVERIAKELGAPTILVNNAGIIRDDMLFKMPLELSLIHI